MSTSVIRTLVYPSILAWSRRVQIIEVGLYLPVGQPPYCRNCCPTVTIVLWANLAKFERIWPIFCTRAIYCSPGQYITPLGNIFPACAIYCLVGEYIAQGLKFTFFLQCSMAYIVLAVPLIHPRNGIQMNVEHEGCCVAVMHVCVKPGSQYDACASIASRASG